MRTYLLFLSLLLLSVSSVAQPQAPVGATPARESMLERLSSMPGTILVKDISDIGDLKTVKLQLVKVANAEDANQQFNFARFVYKYQDINSPNVKAIYCDISGIDELTRNFNMMETKVFSKKSSGYTETSFKTRDGIVGGCYWSKGAWMIYLKFVDKEDDVYITFEREDFNKLVSLLDLTKSKLLPTASGK